jgi:hypothetical protein
MYPSPDLLRRLRMAGVPITFGSDAHRPEEVGRDFAQAIVLAQDAGYDAFATLAPDANGGRARIAAAALEHAGHGGPGTVIPGTD